MKATNSTASFATFLTLSVLAIGQWRAHAQFSSVPREDFWIGRYPGGGPPVVETNGSVFLGGLQWLVQTTPNTLLSFNAISGIADTDFPKVSGLVYAMISDGGGGWYIGGQFAAVGNVSITNLAHIRNDRTVDANWKPNPDRVVYVLSLEGNTLYIGGEFSQVGEQARSRVAALEADTGRVSVWNPNIEFENNPGFGRAMAIAISEGVVYIGGRFTHVGGKRRLALAAVDARTGVTTDWNAGIEGSPYAVQILALTVQRNLLYVGGDEFTRIGGETRTRIAALDRATGKATTWNPNPTSQGGIGVGRIVVHCEKVFVVGAFERIGGQLRRNVAALDVQTGEATAWDPELQDFSPISNLVPFGNTIYVGGYFVQIGGQRRNYLAALDAETGKATGWNPVVSGPVGTLALAGSTLAATQFQLSSINPPPNAIRRNGMAALDAVTGSPTTWNPPSTIYPTTLAFLGNTLYVGGQFAMVGDQPRNSFAALDPINGQLRNWNPDVRSLVDNPISLEVLELAVSADTVFAAILGFSPPNTSRHAIAAMDAFNGQTRWAHKADGYILALSATGNRLYVGGYFTTIAGTARNHLASFDVTTGTLSDWNPSVLNGVNALAVSGNTIYTGGSDGVLAFDIDTGERSNWDPNAGPGVNKFVGALAVFENTLFVGGDFRTIGGRSRNYLASFNTQTGTLTDWNPNPSFAVGSITVGEHALYVGGDFDVIGGRFLSRFAVFPREGSPLIDVQPRSQNVPSGRDAELTVTPSGQAPFFFQWRFNGTELRGATNSTLTIPNAQIKDSGLYSVVVTNRIGLVNSSEASLLVFTAPALTSQPQPRSAAPGAIVTFSASATGNPPPVYQWRRNGVNIPGEFSSSLALTNAQPADGGSYSVVAVNIGGAVSSQEAELIVSSPDLPFSDNLRDRVVNNSVSGVGSGNNRLASREAGEPFHAEKIGSKSLWLGWRAPVNGVATFSTRGSAFDTLLAVYTNRPNASLDFANLGVVASDDDRGGFLTSEVAFNTVAGTEYLIAIDGFGESSGNIVLSWRVDTAVTEVPRIFQQPVSQTVGRGETVTLGVSAFSTQSLTYQWYQNCDRIDGATNATVTVSNVQAAQVGQYRVRVSNGVQEVESEAALIEINFSGTAGLVQKVGSRDKLADRAVLAGNVAPASVAEKERVPPGRLLSISEMRGERSRESRDAELAAPGFGGAPARGLSGTQIFHTFGSAKEIGEPNHCGEAGGASSWYSVLAEEDGMMTVSTEGSDFDTVLAVYEGPANPLGYDELILPAVACDNNSGSDRETSRLSFAAKQNQVYHIAVDGVNGARGRVNLTYQLERAPPRPPSITVQPQSQSVLVGASVTFSVSVSGSAPLTYQWRWNGSDMAGFTNAVLVLTNVQPAQAGSYAVVISNALGSVTSGVASLIVAMSPTIIQQPQAQTVIAGGDVTIRVVATGDEPLSYQWKFNGNDRPGATNSTLTLNNVQPANAGSYSVVVSNAAGSVTSAGAALSVLVGPTIADPPQSQTVIAGTNVVFSVEATGTEPLSYQWKFNGNDLSGATNSVLILTNIQAINAGSYTVAVSNAAGSTTSAAAILIVLVAPMITDPPQSQTVIAGTNVIFSVETTGTEPLSYQWKFNGNDLSGATNSVLILANIQAVNAGRYSVVVSNPAGSVTSAEAILTVEQLVQLRLESWVWLPGRGFQVRLSGTLGPNTAIQASTNLFNWFPVFTNTLTSAIIEFTDPSATNYSARFYRAVK